MIVCKRAFHCLCCLEGGLAVEAVIPISRALVCMPDLLPDKVDVYVPIVNER